MALHAAGSGNNTHSLTRIGIRMALGARRADVVGAVWATAQRAMIIGLTVGLALAMGGAQLLRRFLHGLSPFDPIAYLQIAGILLAAAALATWIPARRAARVDPAVTLRTD
jgi:ABC-type antimicrobial peptide transport system permease subunit